MAQRAAARCGCPHAVFLRGAPELQGRYSYYVPMGVVVPVCVSLYGYLKKVRWL